ncbi:hypothetical protein ACFQH8_05525 [Halomicroarcula sp. GCM10025710]
MVLNDFGQDIFVAPNNYFTLGARRQEEQMASSPTRSNPHRFGPTPGRSHVGQCPEDELPPNEIQ